VGWKSSHTYMYYGVQLYSSPPALIVLWMLCTMCVVDVTGARLGGKSYTAGESKCVRCRGGRWMQRFMEMVVEQLQITSGSPNVGVVFPTCLHLPTSPLAWKPLIPKPLSRQRSQTQRRIHILNSSTSRVE